MSVYKVDVTTALTTVEATPRGDETEGPPMTLSAPFGVMAYGIPVRNLATDISPLNTSSTMSSTAAVVTVSLQPSTDHAYSLGIAAGVGAGVAVGILLFAGLVWAMLRYKKRVRGARAGNINEDETIVDVDRDPTVPKSDYNHSAATASNEMDRGAVAELPTSPNVVEVGGNSVGERGHRPFSNPMDSQPLGR